MTPSRFTLLWGAVLSVSCLAGCTPLGGWLYSDPTFSLAGVGSDGSVSDSMQLVLTGCNLNDYDLYALAFQGTLAVRGRRVAVWGQRIPLQMRTRDSSRVAMPLLVEDAEWGDAVEPMAYQLTGTALVRTPIGDRSVPVDQRGTVRLVEGDPVEWTVRNSQACRPGQVPAPHLATPKQIIRPEDFRRP